MRHAELKPELSSSIFPVTQSRIQEHFQGRPSKTRKINVDILSYGRENRKRPNLDPSCADEFLDDIDDQDLIEVGKVTLCQNLARDADPTQSKIWTSFTLTALMPAQYHKLQNQLFALINAIVARLKRA